MQVRPTSDRLRETLFNVLAPRIQDTRFLDLCAGSGAVGIEALSRGSAHSTFVDRSRKMCGLIESNLDLCRIPEDQTQVVQAEAGEFLRQAISRKLDPWTIVFFDPPYADDYLGTLRFVGSNTAQLLAEEGLLQVFMPTSGTRHFRRPDRQPPDTLVTRPTCGKVGDVAQQLIADTQVDLATARALLWHSCWLVAEGGRA